MLHFATVRETKELKLCGLGTSTNKYLKYFTNQHKSNQITTKHKLLLVFPIDTYEIEQDESRVQEKQPIQENLGSAQVAIVSRCWSI